MSGHRETNPYFVHFSDQQPPHEVPHPRLHPQYEYPQQLPTRTPHSPPPPQPSSPPHQTRVPPPKHRTRTRPSKTDRFPPYLPPHQTQTPPPRPGPETDHFPVHQPPHHPTQPSRDEPDEPTHPSSKVRMPHQRKTPPYTWLIGVVCALFWIAVVLGGLVVLVVYLLFRPRGPKFDISATSLNAAYLDMGYLLNADMTILANFTNPSKKATVDFHYIYVNLYFENTLVSTTYVEPFKAMKAESAFRNVHLVSSQVGLPLRERQKMTQQIEGNRIRFEVKASLRTRSNLGSLFRYSYWLFGHCLIEVTGPPSGVLVGKKCMTKR
ncbi:hypothetical protein C3L33_13943, partial [Rhododendron williamsianum]